MLKKTGQQKLARHQLSSPSAEKATQGIKNSEKPDQRLLTCTSSKVDLLILLDTSGSIFHSFDHERGIAMELVEKIEPQAFSNQPFSWTAQILESLKSIQFTGKNTRIANAVQTVVEQLEKLGRKEAKQIVVIISDGHGQEFWNKAQTAGKRLQAIGAEIFAVTTSTDYNAAELKLYTGEQNNVFVGTNHTHFVPALSEMINQCLGSPSSENLTQNLLNKQTNSTQNSTIAEIMSFPDPFQLQKENAETDTTNGETQKNNQPLEKSVSKSITNESSSQLDTPQPTNSEEESQALSILSQRLRDQQNTSKGPDDCLTDVILLVDKANPTEPHFNYTKQLDLLTDFVGRLDAGDVDMGKIKLAAVSFGGKVGV
uniref:VWFA domain-containing protein n=1 Tax=Ditylenchus dipsaci TaxID=166011 RepID=A0A915D4D3_9BILA